MPAKLIDLSEHKNFSVQAKKDNTEAEIIMYDIIGGDFFNEGITAKQVQKELASLPSTIKNINVRINSPGGAVFEGWAIYNLLRQHPAKITTHVDGMAASIASVIALAGDKVIMGEGSQMMIHSAWTYASGNVRDFERVIDRLMSIDDQLVRTYMKKTKKDRSEVEAAVKAETWFTAKEAVDFGLADAVAEHSMPIAASVLSKATWLKNIPKDIVTDQVKVKSEISNLKNKIESFLARK